MKISVNDKRFNQGRAGSDRRRGFTLVELLVVIAILAVLALLSFVAMRKVNQAAKSATCMSNLRQMGSMLVSYAGDHGGQLPALQPAYDPELGKRPPIWPVTLAEEGYMYDGTGPHPCGTGVWTCPSCDFMSNAYGGYGVVEGEIFVYEENRPRLPRNSRAKGSLRMSQFDRPADTWLVGDASREPGELNKGWYAIWSNPKDWEGGHYPSARHGNKINMCMVDGHVEALTLQEIEDRKMTRDVVRD